MRTFVRSLAVMAASCLVTGFAFAQCPAFPQVPPDPTNPSAIAQTAWQIFVAAACPTSTPQQYPYITWETWVEQAQEYPALGSGAAAAARKRVAAHRLHASPLALVLAHKVSTTATGPGFGSNDCNFGNQPGFTNVTICEEARLNPAAQNFVNAPAPGASLQFRIPQAKFATAPASGGWSTNVNFPQDAVEIKVDWIQYTGSCPSAVTGSVWTETYGGNCYALAGMHVISKLLPNWIWATFEPQNATTNSQRCIVLGCNDPFGSVPASTPPGTGSHTTQLSQPLQAMMTAANLNPVWQNYRLDGVQTNFVKADLVSPTLLGNSVIEGENVGMPLTQASCITCHFESSINSAGTDGAATILGNPNAPVFIGIPPTLPLGYIGRDFVWSLSMACADSPFGSVSNCPAPSAPGTAKKKRK